MLSLAATERDSNSPTSIISTAYAFEKREYCYEEGSYRGRHRRHTNRKGGVITCLTSSPKVGPSVSSRVKSRPRRGRIRLRNDRIRRLAACPTPSARTGSAEAFVVDLAQPPQRDSSIDRQAVNRMSRSSRRTRWLTRREACVLTERKRLTQSNFSRQLTDDHNAFATRWLRQLSRPLS